MANSLVKRRKRDRRLVITIPSVIVDVLRQVVTEVGDVVASPPPGNVTDRLFPRAYLDPTEETAERDWQSVVHDDLVRGRLEAVTGILADLDAGTPIARERVEIVIDAQPEHEQRWLTVLNDARLTLGTLLEVTEDEPLQFPHDDPRAAAAQVYALLSELQGALVDVLLDELPDPGVDDHGPF
jgi:Domain of unknown function (DUF2017)